MVHQHFMLIPVMTVAENIVLGEEPRRDGVLLDYAKAEQSASPSSRGSFKFAIDPHALVAEHLGRHSSSGSRSSRRSTAARTS